MEAYDFCMRWYANDQFSSTFRAWCMHMAVLGSMNLHTSPALESSKPGEREATPRPKVSCLPQDRSGDKVLKAVVSQALGIRLSLLQPAYVLRARACTCDCVHADQFVLGSRILQAFTMPQCRHDNSLQPQPMQQNLTCCNLLCACNKEPMATKLSTRVLEQHFHKF